LSEDEEAYFDAWLELSRVRPIGFGVAAIPITEIEAWLRLHSIDPWDRSDWYGMIIFLDCAWVARMRKKESDDGKHAAAGDQG
jgi:hypothetical protein